MMDTQDLSIAAMGRALRAGTVTAQQLARDALARIAATRSGVAGVPAGDRDTRAGRRAPRRRRNCKPAATAGRCTAFPMR